MADAKQEQVERAERLQGLWLKHMESLLTEGTITSTDLATLARVFMSNGWVLDAQRLPQTLRDKITAHVDPTVFDEDDDVVGRIA